MKAIRKLNIWAVATLMAAFCSLILACGRVEAAVTILSQPASVEKKLGDSVAFSVLAKSNRSIRYYWYKDGKMLGNKTPTLTISSITERHAGKYYCLVSDGVSKTRCSEFTLTIGQQKTYVVTWDRPTTRANGTALAVNQIAGYRVLLDGVVLGFTAATIYEFPLPPGQPAVTLITVDTAGLVSRPSDALIIGR